MMSTYSYSVLLLLAILVVRGIALVLRRALVGGGGSIIGVVNRVLGGPGFGGGEEGLAVVPVLLGDVGHERVVRVGFVHEQLERG